MEYMGSQKLWRIKLKLSDGLLKLQELARIDGSLGWTVTCAAAPTFYRKPGT